MQDPDLYCYRLSYFIDYDVELVWQLVQRHGGYISVQVGGDYEFHVPREYAPMILMAFPLLTRQRQKDLYV
jgi:hypothetical protein